MLQEGQICECTVAKAFCTQCGKPLLEGQVCECVVTNEAQKTFVVPEQLPDFEPIVLAEPHLYSDLVPEKIPFQEPVQRIKPPLSRNTFVEKPTIGASIKSIGQGTVNGNHSNMTQLVPEHVCKISGEVPVKQYHISQCRNLLRFNRAAGYLAVTNKRVVFKAEAGFFGKKTIIQREHSIDNIAGFEAVSNYRLSAARALLGLITLATFAALTAAGVIWFTHGALRSDIYVGYFMARPSIGMVLPWAIEGLREGWSHDIGSVSLGVGLVAGFGGVALFFLLRGKFWIRLAFLGVSVGGFGASALTYNLYAFVLLVLSMMFAVLGLVLFAWLPDLVISVISKEGRVMRLVYGRRLADIFYGTAGAGYAEVAPVAATGDAIWELGAIIKDVQDMGADGVEKWKEN